MTDRAVLGFSLEFGAATADGYTRKHLGWNTERVDWLPDTRLSEIRALVVDDDELNRVLLARLLTQIGVHEVLVESEAYTFDDIVRSHDPSLILIDLHLGSVDGIDVVGAHARRDPHWDTSRVVLVTGESAADVRERAEAAGIGEILEKPYDAAELRAVVERVIGGVPVPRYAPVAVDANEPDFRSLFESAPGSCLVLDVDLRIVGASDDYLRDTMTERDAILGRELFEVFPDNPDDQAADGEDNLRASLERVRTKKVPDAMAVQKYDIRRPSGEFEVRYWSPLNVPVLGRDRQLQYIIHRVQDVTDLVVLRQSEAEQQQATALLKERTSEMELEIVRRSRELQDTNRELRAANAAKSEFLSRASHELRTPLTAILGFSELLKGSEIGGDEREWVHIIHRAGGHLLGLLNDVLDIARIDSGQLSMSLEAVAVQPVLKDVLSLVQPLADARNITLETSYLGFSRSYVLADNQRLRQVLINLMSNAIKYNRVGGEITVSVVDADPFVRIGVTDTGLGLTNEQIAKLFRPFERLDAPSSGVEGTGLGLALSRDLINAMGGTLDVKSNVDIGSTFTIELRLVEPNAVSSDVVEHDDALDSRGYDGTRTVLYVEDMVANARLVQEILKRRPDVTLMSAMFGGMAVELAQEHLPDMVLLDLHLPDMDGVEVLRRLRSDPRTARIPVVILSADATGVHTDELEAEGAQMFLTKPIGVSKLLDVVDRFLLTP